MLRISDFILLRSLNELRTGDFVIDSLEGIAEFPNLKKISELTRWLVENGADINLKDSTYGRTPLYIHSGRISGDVKVLLELGAYHTIKDKYGNTPLHSAARAANLRCVEQLIAYGADIDAVGNRGLTPLEAALEHGRDFVNLAEIADIFLGRGQKITSQMQQHVTRMGEDFEFRRQDFEHSQLIAVDAALTRLYQLFEVQLCKASYARRCFSHLPFRK